MIEVAGLDVPTSWDDITFGEYCRMYGSITDDMSNEEKVIHLICDLLSITPGIYFDLKKSDIDKINDCLSFLNKPIVPCDGDLEIDGKSYIIPIFDDMTYRQYIDIESGYDENAPYNILPLASCLFVEAGQKYTTEKAKEIETLLMVQPCTRIVGLVLSYIEKKKSLIKDITILQTQKQPEITAKQ